MTGAGCSGRWVNCAAVQRYLRQGHTVASKESSPTYLGRDHESAVGSMLLRLSRYFSAAWLRPCDTCPGDKSVLYARQLSTLYARYAVHPGLSRFGLSQFCTSRDSPSRPLDSLC